MVSCEGMEIKCAELIILNLTHKKGRITNDRVFYVNLFGHSFSISYPTKSTAYTFNIIFASRVGSSGAILSS